MNGPQHPLFIPGTTLQQAQHLQHAQTQLQQLHQQAALRRAVRPPRPPRLPRPRLRLLLFLRRLLPL
jgi:hypothetical protein